MAKIDLKFLDFVDNCWIEVKELDGIISIFTSDDDREDTTGICVYLDKSTAIKFAKTLRTEINKIQD
jgi:hypothetical protein